MRVRKGDKVVMILAGAGVETASVQTITRVSKGRISLDATTATFDIKTGRGESWIPGFTQRIIALEA